MAIQLLIKKQSGRGTPATGSGAFELRVRPGGRMQRTAATIARSIIDRSGMKAKDRQGSIQAPLSYETELEARNADGIFMGVNGCAVTASIALSQVELTSLAISGSGTILTAGGGSFRSLGLKAGMLVRLGGMATSANNGVWVPVLAVGTTTLTVAPWQFGTLVDETADTTFTLITGHFYAAPTPRLKEYYTAEAYDDVKDQSKLTTDARFINLQLAAAANQVATLGFGLLGRDMEVLDTAAAPSLTSTTAEGEALLLLDGALWKNAVLAAQVTSLTLGLQAQGNITPLATSRVGADVGVSQFALTASLNELVNDYSALQSAIDEDPISLMAMFANRAAPTEIVSVYAGNCSYAQADDQIADDDSEESAQNATLYGGKDTRGEALGFAASTLCFSTTADL